MLDFFEDLCVFNSINLSALVLWVRNFDKASNSFSEFLSSHTGVLQLGMFFRNDSSIFGNGNSCVNVVSSAHDCGDACLFGLLNAFNDSGSQWVLQAEKSDSNKLIFKHFSVSFLFEVVVLTLIFVEVCHRHVSVGDQNSSVSLVGKVLHCGFKDFN